MGDGLSVPFIVSWLHERKGNLVPRVGILEMKPEIHHAQARVVEM